MMKNTLFLFAFLLTTIIACVKPPDYPPEPRIEFVSLSKNTVPQSAISASDTVQVVISFTDGDGDISFDDETNPRDLFLIDTRNGDELAFSLPSIEDIGTSNGLSGEITIDLLNNNLCCNYPPEVAVSCEPAPAQFPEYQRDTLTLEIYMKDRAGNVSNTVETDMIILLCE